MKEPERVNLLKHLSRITTPGRTFIPQIDGLRFVAIMSVIGYHVRGICLFHFRTTAPGDAYDGSLIEHAMGVGHVGVRLFFAISGFILCLPFARQFSRGGRGVSLRQYYLRRVTRIEPPYVFHLIFLFALCGLVLRRLPSHPNLYHNEAWAGFTLKHLLPSLFYAHGFVFGAHPYPNLVLWSLEVEVQFYILAPFLARVFLLPVAWQRRTLLAGVILLLPLILEWGGWQGYWAQFSLIGNLSYFLVGFLLADFYLSDEARGAAGGRKWDVLFLMSGIAVVPLARLPHSSLTLPWAFLIFSLAAFRGVASAKFLGLAWITTIGGMCYTIYMYHMVMISLLVRVTGSLRTHYFGLDLLIQYVLLSSIIIVVCSVPFALLERPFMRRDWPARVWAALRNRQRVVAPVPIERA
jgi:peptidoglycan/LPS O-acetylase OafA/YrhL